MNKEKVINVTVGNVCQTLKGDIKYLNNSLIPPILRNGFSNPLHPNPNQITKEGQVYHLYEARYKNSQCYVND